MNDEQWERIIDKIDQAYGIKEKRLEKEGRIVTEWIVFSHPHGEIKIERITRPLLIGEKRYYTKRPGTQAYIEPVYSETEFLRTVKLYLRHGHNWKEIDFKSGMGLL